MARYFDSITKEGLQSKILEAFKKAHPDEYAQAETGHRDNEEEGAVDYLGSIRYWPDLNSKVSKDLGKVQFDFENVDANGWMADPSGGGMPLKEDDPMRGLIGLHTLENGLTFCGVRAGGDWEKPVFFIIYWDGKSLRGYIPEGGNPFNTATMQAYGNDEEADANNKLKLYGLKDQFMDQNWTLIKQDIMGRILPREGAGKAAAPAQVTESAKKPTLGASPSLWPRIAAFMRPSNCIRVSGDL